MEQQRTVGRSGDWHPIVVARLQAPGLPLQKVAEPCEYRILKCPLSVKHQPLRDTHLKSAYHFLTYIGYTVVLDVRVV